LAPPFSEGIQVSVMLQDARQKARRIFLELGRIAQEPWLIISILAIFTLLALFIILPILKVVQMSLAPGESVLATYFNLFRSWYMRRALVNSLITGVLSAVLAVFVGFIMAYTVTRVNIPFKKFFNMVAIIPVISPPCWASGISPSTA